MPQRSFKHASQMGERILWTSTTRSQLQVACPPSLFAACTRRAWNSGNSGNFCLKGFASSCPCHVISASPKRSRKVGAERPVCSRMLPSGGFRNYRYLIGVPILTKSYYLGLFKSMSGVPYFRKPPRAYGAYGFGCFKLGGFMPSTMNTQCQDP